MPLLSQISRFFSAPPRIVLVLLGAAPPLFLAWLIASLAVNLPHWDQWETPLDLFLLHKQGALSFAHFWEQHNEHRIFFPKLIFFALGVLSHWNTVWEMWFSYALAWLILGALLMQLRYAARPENGGHGLSPWLYPLGAFMVFSLTQYENWFWGFQIQWFLNVLALCGCGAFLARRPFTWAGFIGMGVCGGVAMFSLSSGVLMWGVAFLLLSIPAWREKERRGRTVLLFPTAWALLFVVLLGVYMLGYANPVNERSFTQFLSKLPDFGRYVLTYIGGPLAVTSRDIGMPVAGAFGILLFAWLAWRILFRLPVEQGRARMFFVFLGGYAVASALITGYGRIHLGPLQAGESRYATISLLLWYSTICLLLLEQKPNFSTLGWGRRFLAALRRYAVPAIIVLLILANTLPIYIFVQRRQAAQQRAHDALLQRRAAPELRMIYPNLEKLNANQLPALYQARLSLFNELPQARAPQ